MSGLIYSLIQGAAVVMTALGIMMTGKSPKRFWLLAAGIAILHATIGK